MFKNVLVLTSLILIVFWGVGSGLVGGEKVQAAAEKLYSPITSQGGIYQVLIKIAQFLFTAFLIIAVIFIIIAAFSYLTAGGDAEKVKKASQQILWAVIAIAIVLISGGAAALIKSFFTVAT